MQTGDVLVPSVEGQVIGGPPAGARSAGARCAPVQEEMGAKGGNAGSSPLFDLSRMQTCLDHANAVTNTYGVNILSINVVAAVPADKQLMVSLAQGAVAAAEAQKFEIVASGKAAAAKIEARGLAEASILKARGDSEAQAVRAQGEASAEKTRAEGQKAAADTLTTNEVAVKLATIDRTGQALGDGNKTFFFGADPKEVGSLLTTAAVVPLVSRP